MSFEWDYRNAASNLRKHGVDFADAVTVFDDPLALTMPDTRAGEQRFATLAADATGRILVVVYTWRENAIRLISARRASPRERKRYEE
jgi:uncharacterized DUF497 family protein